MAGAFDSFGPRMAILQVMERLVMISSSHFQAKEAGQLTFFGAESDMGQRIQLPMVDPDYNRREQLNWERELIGLFISDHPLSSVYEKLKDKISHTSGQLSQVEDGQGVRVLGMVSRIRPHITKKGDPMGFAGLEDIQGMIDLVIFPRTWKKYQESIRYDQVFVVEGKIDAESGEPKLLVDRIIEDFDGLSSLKDYYAKRENVKKWRNNYKKKAPKKQFSAPPPEEKVQKTEEIKEEIQQEIKQDVNDQSLERSVSSTG
jgi:DNA polymerase-3 subunit alpha